MSFGKLIICGNHTGNVADVPARTITAIRNTKNIFFDHLPSFNEDIILKYQIDITDKNIFEVGNIFQEEITAGMIKESLLNEEDAVFICDTGLPGFADKGVNIINLIHDAGIEVEVVSGPSILSSAIAVAGIPSNGNHICGLSVFDFDADKRSEALRVIQSFPGTTVVLDYPENIYEDLEILFGFGLNNRMAAICINVGMDSQKILRGTVSELLKSKLAISNCYTSIAIQGSE